MPTTSSTSAASAIAAAAGRRRVLAGQLQLRRAAPRCAHPVGSARRRLVPDCRHRPLPGPLVTPEPQQAIVGGVVIVEGLFLHRDSLSTSWDYSIFLDVPFAVTARRLADRDGTPADPGHPQMRRYVEGQRIYYRSCRPWLRAKQVIDNSDPRAVRLLTRAEADRRPSR